MLCIQFDNSNRPKSINLPAGLGKVFQRYGRSSKVLKIEIARLLTVKTMKEKNCYSKGISEQKSRVNGKTQ